MHLAAALGVPGVWLYGPTDPGLTGPYGDGQTVIRSTWPEGAVPPAHLHRHARRRLLHAGDRGGGSGRRSGYAQPIAGAVSGRALARR